MSLVNRHVRQVERKGRERTENVRDPRLRRSAHCFWTMTVATMAMNSVATMTMNSVATQTMMNKTSMINRASITD